MIYRRFALAAVVAAALWAAPSIVRADQTFRKPWKLSFSTFQLTDSNLDKSTGGALQVDYVFRSLGTRRQNEDAFDLTFASVNAQVAGASANVRLFGLLYEHTWGFGSGYFAAGAGPLQMSVENGGSTTDMAFASRLGVYLDRKQTFSLEAQSLSGGRRGNTGSGIALSFRF